METCTFCGRTIAQVGRMVVSPIQKDVFICDKCSEIAAALISGDINKKEAKPLRKACKNLQLEAIEGDRKESDGTLSMTPREIHRELDKYVIGQEKAKKILSVAVYNHNKRLNDETGLIKKSNILIVGPSGCGKTLLARTLARMLNLPFVISDATGLTEAGYVGDDVEVMLQRLIEVADGDIELAQKGIIYIDEIDKISRKGESRSMTRDVSGEGVQESLLKLIEGCEITVPVHDRRKHPHGENVTFNTSNVLFICGGAFEGLFDSAEHRAVGFNTGNQFKTIDTDTLTNKKLTVAALKKYGMMAELVGRLPIRCVLNELTEDDLVRVLTEPEDAITKEYELLFEKDGVKLTYEKDALMEIARMAVKNNTGARGLRTILEDVMLDIMYVIPDRKDISECIITKESLLTKEPILILLKNKKTAAVP